MLLFVVVVSALLDAHLPLFCFFLTSVKLTMLWMSF